MIPKTLAHPTRGWTIEHVYPRSLRIYENEGNRLVSHSACNNIKGDRQPTGCEVILLHATNARLGIELTERCRRYSDDVRGPSALAVALSEALAA